VLSKALYKTCSFKLDASGRCISSKPHPYVAKPATFAKFVSEHRASRPLA